MQAGGMVRGSRRDLRRVEMHAQKRYNLLKERARKLAVWMACALLFAMLGSSYLIYCWRHQNEVHIGFVFVMLGSTGFVALHLLIGSWRYTINSPDMYIASFNKILPEFNLQLTIDSCSCVKLKEIRASDQTNITN